MNMNKKELEAFAKKAAKGIKTPEDLNEFSQMLKKITVEAALNADKVEVIAKNNATKKRTIVFAVAKFMSQKDLTEKRIEFCQLPYAIHRIMGA